MVVNRLFTKQKDELSCISGRKHKEIYLIVHRLEISTQSKDKDIPVTGHGCP
jgi:hypothetical protein